MVNTRTRGGIDQHAQQRQGMTRVNSEPPMSQNPPPIGMEASTSVVRVAPNF